MQSAAPTNSDDTENETDPAKVFNDEDLDTLRELENFLPGLADDCSSCEPATVPSPVCSSPARCSAASVDTIGGHPDVPTNRNPSRIGVGDLKTPGDTADLFTSNDWMADYKETHVDIEYSAAFFSSGDSSRGLVGERKQAAGVPTPGVPAASVPAESLPVASEPPRRQPQRQCKAKGPNLMRELVSDFNNLMSSLKDSDLSAQSLSDHVDGADSDASQSVDAQPTSHDEDWPNDEEAIKAEENTIAPSPPRDTTPPKSPTQRKKRKPRPKRNLEPNQKVYVEPNELDVLLGRGGRSNHHPGNKRYLSEVEKIRDWYKQSDKNDKTSLSQSLVDFVKKYGGRFLKLDESNGKWYIVTNIVARRKASQALREENTPAKRAAKRERYKK